MHNIHLGNHTDSLTLRIHGRIKPDSQSYWDANWLHCSAEVSAGAFRGTLEWQLRNEDLARFMDALERLGGLAGDALLDTLDGWLEVRVVRDERGHIEARCQLDDNARIRSTLEFGLPLDQLAISALLSQLRAVLDWFPIVGKEGT